MIEQKQRELFCLQIWTGYFYRDRAKSLKQSFGVNLIARSHSFYLIPSPDISSNHPELKGSGYCFEFLLPSLNNSSSR